MALPGPLQLDISIVASVAFLCIDRIRTIAATRRTQVTFTLAIVHQKTKEPIVSATFSKLFSRQAPSWGKNNFVDVNDIFQSDKSVYDDDTVLFHCDITAVNSIGHELEDAGTVANGRHRCGFDV